MTITDRITSLSESLLGKIHAKTLPEQAEALEAANTVAENPAALTEARARVTQLEGELSAANAKIADMEKRVNALVEQRVAAVIAENAKLKAEARTAEERAVEVMASVGVTVPFAAAPNIDGKTNNPTRALTGVEAVAARYKASGLYEDKS